ncbi:hypothetical protein VNO78_25103 [Psophocarpus tetragonolobus]|uniref:Uncharacterized protein n=1 Tax=Psophocarpus tetragonolobus TaxID=3891 RepID=A0AAN9S592_PSOTE
MYWNLRIILCSLLSDKRLHSLITFFKCSVKPLQRITNLINKKHFELVCLISKRIMLDDHVGLGSQTLLLM